LRRKIAAALGENVSEGDSDSRSDTSSELQMDDDQMMQLDEKLADIFKAHSSTKGKIGTRIVHHYLRMNY
jgi:DNA polymerase phi